MKPNLLSTDFIDKTIELVTGKVSPEILDLFFEVISREIKNTFFIRSSESNLLRILQNQLDVPKFISDCVKYPHHVDILLKLAANSNYLTDIIVRNPEYFQWIINPVVLNEELNLKKLELFVENTVSVFRTYEKKINALKNLKRKELLRIGLKDIYLKEDIKITTANLSYLAKSVSAKIFEISFDEILLKHNITLNKKKYCVVSLGKLGGNELNYSSDIDLIVFYDKNNRINRKIFFNELLSEAILLFIDSISSLSAPGFLYRVDFRLRPDGRNAPLCGSVADYIKYYETRGEGWERQMLIKADFLCGSKSLYNNFTNNISRFIYHTPVSRSPQEQIKKIKASIEKKFISDSNIKLTRGGIRDIEFSIQALQLINGAKHKEIRSANSIDSLIKLNKNQFISDDEFNVLNDGYIFYRKVEHFLQLMNNQQTHDVPEEGELAEKLSSYMGFSDLKEFQKRLNLIKRKVRAIYDSIINIETDNQLAFNIKEIRFNDIKRSSNNLEFLKYGKGLLKTKAFDNRTVESFEIIEPELYSYLTNAIDPDLVLENFVRIIKPANFPKIWYDEFKDKNFFRLFLQICETNQKAIDLFAEDKLLRDDFLSRGFLSLRLKDSINFKQLLFRLSSSLTSKQIVIDELSKALKNYYSEIIKSVTEDFLKEKIYKDDLLVASMGSFGRGDLNFASDIDLIFISKSTAEFSDIQKDAQNLLQLYKKAFGNTDVDCRLRPEGKSSLLVWDITEYINYFNGRIRVWELQAFLKFNFIYGNKLLFDKLLSEFLKVLNNRSLTELKNEMLEMRSKMYPISDDSLNIKKNSGGLIDIDFIVSFHLLTNPEMIYACKGLNTLDCMNKLKMAINSDTNFISLIKDYSFLKNVEVQSQNVFNSRLPKIPTDEIKLQKLSEVCGFSDPKEFIKILSASMNRTKTEFKTIFGKK